MNKANDAWRWRTIKAGHGGKAAVGEGAHAGERQQRVAALGRKEGAHQHRLHKGYTLGSGSKEKGLVSHLGPDLFVELGVGDITMIIERRRKEEEKKCVL